MERELKNIERKKHRKSIKSQSTKQME